MSATKLFLPMTMILLGVLVGCNRSTSQPVATKDKATETKLVKFEQLEIDLSNALDEQKRLKTLIDDEKNKWVNLTKERDELRKQVESLTAERDQALAQYEGFRKGIRDMLGNADAAAAPVKPIGEGSAVSVIPPAK